MELEYAIVTFWAARWIRPVNGRRTMIMVSCAQGLKGTGLRGQTLYVGKLGI